MKKLIIRIIIFSLLFLIFHICLFVYKQPISYLSKIDSNLFSDFGTYIGGTLGLVLTSVTIYLLYGTFTIQKEQMLLQEEDSTLRNIDLQYNQIVKDIEGIKFDGKSGVDALHGWNETHKKENNPNNVFNTLNFILHTFSNHVNTINRFNTKYKLREELLERAYLMLHSKIIWPVIERIYLDSSFENHTDKTLFNNFNKLTKATYDYLLDDKRQMLSEPTNESIIKIRAGHYT